MDALVLGMFLVLITDIYQIQYDLYKNNTFFYANKQYIWKIRD